MKKIITAVPALCIKKLCIQNGQFCVMYTKIFNTQVPGVCCMYTNVMTMMIGYNFYSSFVRARTSCLSIFVICNTILVFMAATFTINKQSWFVVANTKIKRTWKTGWVALVINVGQAKDSIDRTKSNLLIQTDLITNNPTNRVVHFFLILPVSERKGWSMFNNDTFVSYFNTYSLPPTLNITCHRW